MGSEDDVMWEKTIVCEKIILRDETKKCYERFLYFLFVLCQHFPENMSTCWKKICEKSTAVMLSILSGWEITHELGANFMCLRCNVMACYMNNLYFLRNSRYWVASNVHRVRNKRRSFITSKSLERTKARCSSACSFKPEKCNAQLAKHSSKNRTSSSDTRKRDPHICCIFYYFLSLPRFAVSTDYKNDYLPQETEKETTKKKKPSRKDQSHLTNILSETNSRLRVKIWHQRRQAFTLKLLQSARH